MTENIYTPDLQDLLKLIPHTQMCQDWVLMARSQEMDLAHFNKEFLYRPVRIMGTCIGLSAFSTPGNTIVVNGREYFSREGQGTLVLLKPGDIVYSEIKPSSMNIVYLLEMSSRHLQIDMSRLLPVIFHVHNEPVIYLSLEELKDLQDHYERALAYIARQDEWGRQIFVRLLGVYCLRVVELIESRLPAESTALDERSRQETWLLIEFLRLVSAEPSRQKTVAHYAELLHTSYKHFSSIIKRNSGRSAIEWIDFHLLHEIKSLLSYSELSIQEIAYRLHFSSHSHLSKFFRQHTGHTPSEYQALTRSPKG